MMRLLEKIHGGEAASRDSCDEILALMKRCQTGGNRILKYLPRDKVEVAHKTGTVKGVVNDVGIVYPKDKDPYIVCVFTKGIASCEEGWEFVEDGEEAIAKVSKAAYEEFVCK
jgi:beta-lactamase class A